MSPRQSKRISSTVCLKKAGVCIAKLSKKQSYSSRLGTMTQINLHFLDKTQVLAPSLGGKSSTILAKMCLGRSLILSCLPPSISALFLSVRRIQNLVSKKKKRWRELYCIPWVLMLILTVRTEQKVPFSSAICFSTCPNLYNKEPNSPSSTLIEQLKSM